MAALEEEDIVDDQQFEALLTFTPEVQEAIEQARSLWFVLGIYTIFVSVCKTIASTHTIFSTRPLTRFCWGTL